MPRFSVIIYRRVEQFLDLGEIEAADEREARQKAESAKAASEEGDWTTHHSLEREEDSIVVSRID